MKHNEILSPWLRTCDQNVPVFHSTAQCARVQSLLIYILSYGCLSNRNLLVARRRLFGHFHQILIEGWMI